jgi:hypothetical protein
MGTSKHAFDQVKNILAKLDRSIDDVRARRLGNPPAGRSAMPSQAVPRLRDAGQDTPIGRAAGGPATP